MADIVILTEAGDRQGFGHLTRCLALYEACVEGKLDALLVVNADHFLSDLLKRAKSETWDWMQEKKKTFSYLKKAKAVIIDSYLAPQPFYEEFSKILSGRLMMIDDYNRLSYPKGIVVNPSLYREKLPYDQKNGVEYWLGKEYVILRKEFWDVPLKELKKKISSVLVTLGGLKHSQAVYGIIERLIADSGFSATVVVPQKKRFSARQMREAMLEADICICGGGQTTYELARVGLPALGICFADNQKMNLKGFHEEGSLIDCGRHENEDVFKNLKKGMEFLNVYANRSAAGSAGRHLIDGQGSKRVIRGLKKKFL